MEIAKQMISRALLAAAAAITVAIAAITMLPAAPAGAQSNDETTGRIVARLLDDGRVEFGWQPVSGARVLPRQRYFPTDATVDRWLRSSPVEVDGEEIGRINARLLSAGRIEFAFTPTDRERITPRARYFPTDTRLGRWLRSTEIAIGHATPRYVAVSAGGSFTCAIRASDSEIACWGTNGDGQTDDPEGSYSDISAGGGHTCAIRTSNSEIACWGTNDGWRGYLGQSDPPTGTFTAVSTGLHHSCGLRTSGEIACWGSNEKYAGLNAETQEHEYADTDQATPPSGTFTAVGAGGWAHSCGLRESGQVTCWGDNTSGQSDAPDGRFTAVSAGGGHTCAIRTNGEIACWGDNRAGQADAPEGSFTTISTGQVHTCAIRESGEITCWGLNGYGQSDAPDGSFAAVSVGYTHTCGLRESGAIECWGGNQHGQTTPPTN